jgi:DNA-binding transcriptional ArsR family regulator
MGPESVMGPESLCGLLAEPDRLRAFAAVVLGARSPAKVAEQTGLNARTVAAALRRLERGGLITDAADGLVAQPDAFRDAVLDRAPSRDEPMHPDRQRDSVLRAFFAADRLTQIPVARGKRRIVLEHIAADFEPGVKYPEKVVDAMLRTAIRTMPRCAAILSARS